jgi:CBS domain-containing protein
MILKEIMTPQVEMIPAGTSLRAAAQKMKSLDVGILPVAGDDDVAGVVTDRDIVIRGVADDRDPAQTGVETVMTDKALSMSADTPVDKAKAAMEQRQVRRLLVVDEQKKVIGIVSLGDLAVRGGEEVGGEALQKVSDPTQPDRPSPSQAAEAST